MICTFPILLALLLSQKSDCLDLIIRKIIGRPPSASEIDGWFKEVSDVDRLSAFCGLSMRRAPAERTNPVYEQAAARSLRRRSEVMAYRIQEELSLPGYPVFWTLTVDPEHEHIIAPRREEFKLWLRKVRRRFGNFTYCCVVERGAEGRLHYHCLFRFDDLSRCTCPNWNRPRGNQQEIPEMRGFWPYGLSNPVAVRYNPADSYGQLGWRWPRGQKTGAPQAVALYMAKYLTKATYEVNGCRTKMSRNFGLHRLQLTLPEIVQVLHNLPQRAIQRLPLTAAPPISIMRRISARSAFGNLPRLPLPPMRTGSVAQAAQTLAMARSIRMSAGDSLTAGPGFEGCLNPYRRTIMPVSIGAIT